MRKLLPALLLGTPIVLAGCMPQAAFETTPVKVPTNYGDVYCQLYTHEMVWWDQAVSYPPGMLLSEANKLCSDVGHNVTSGNGTLR